MNPNSELISALILVVFLIVAMVLFSGLRKSAWWRARFQSGNPKLAKDSNIAEPVRGMPSQISMHGSPLGSPVTEDRRPPVSASPRDLDQHLLNLVDLLDEIEILKKASDGNSKDLEIVQSRLSDLIELSDGEIIRDKEWQPKRQRVVEEVPGSSATPEILSSRQSGLAINGRIVRKQQIILSKPTSKIKI